MIDWNALRQRANDNCITQEDMLAALDEIQRLQQELSDMSEAFLGADDALTAVGLGASGRVIASFRERAEAAVRVTEKK